MTGDVSRTLCIEISKVRFADMGKRKERCCAEPKRTGEAIGVDLLIRCMTCDTRRGTAAERAHGEQPRCRQTVAHSSMENGIHVRFQERIHTNDSQ